MKADIEGPYGEIAKADAVRQVVMTRALRKKDTERSDESAAKDLEIQRLQQELEIEQVYYNIYILMMVSVLRWWLCCHSIYQAERTRAEEQLHHVTAETSAQLQQKDGQIQWAENQILEKDNQILQNEAELEQSRTQLQEKDRQLQQKNVQIHRLYHTVLPIIVRKQNESRQARTQVQPSLQVLINFL